MIPEKTSHPSKRNRMNRRLIAPAALTLGLAAMALVAPAPAYAAPQPWHVKNSINSDGPINIYSRTTCNSGGSIDTLYVGESRTSNGWDGVRVFGRGFSVKVYSGSTGDLIVTRHYDAEDCVRLYDSNDYAVVAGT